MGAPQPGPEWHSMPVTDVPQLPCQPTWEKASLLCREAPSPLRGTQESQLCGAKHVLDPALPAAGAENRPRLPLRPSWPWLRFPTAAVQRNLFFSGWIRCVSFQTNSWRPIGRTGPHDPHLLPGVSGGTCPGLLHGITGLADISEARLIYLRDFQARCREGAYISPRPVPTPQWA